MYIELLINVEIGVTAQFCGGELRNYNQTKDLPSKLATLEREEQTLEYKIFLSIERLEKKPAAFWEGKCQRVLTSGFFWE